MVFLHTEAQDAVKNVSERIGVARTKKKKG